MSLRLAVLLLFGSLSTRLIAKDSVSPEAELQSSLSKFITAFDNLDWEAFRLSFEDDATVFYPRAVPERVGAVNLSGPSERSSSKFEKEETAGHIWISNRGSCRSKC